MRGGLLRVFNSDEGKGASSCAKGRGCHRSGDRNGRKTRRNCFGPCSDGQRCSRKLSRASGRQQCHFSSRCFRKGRQHRRRLIRDAIFPFPHCKRPHGSRCLYRTSRKGRQYRRPPPKGRIQVVPYRDICVRGLVATIGPTIVHHYRYKGVSNHGA